jgi:hypothetical protein
MLGGRNRGGEEEGVGVNPSALAATFWEITWPKCNNQCIPTLFLSFSSKSSAKISSENTNPLLRSLVVSGEFSVLPGRLPKRLQKNGMR